MKKVLFVENSSGFCKFNAPYMNWFKQQGWQVDHAAPGIENRFAYGVTHHYDVDIQNNLLTHSIQVEITKELPFLLHFVLLITDKLYHILIQEKMYINSLNPYF